ncbi:polysaccharide export protein Wza [Shewanella sp. NFH-SH190041]|uniref:polysaccharide export protein n=1 Tax=Shewanella sp. NFH-SH190041 TaxID=2950245 RepID=UPI0021C3B053|nr:polysaccharide export protein [Shewanella sp. NFH-SH190041]BDM62840.1 polysaccharide export protein Wza [Shewanella sp. NFH-SH190041]
MDPTYDNLNVHPLTFQNVSSFNPSIKKAEQDLATIKLAQQYEYRIGIGDVLNIIVYDHPELTTPAGSYRSAAESGNVVHSDGTIFYPYIGKVKVDGSTVSEVRNIIAARLAVYIEQPQVDVSVAAYRSQRIYVTGEVSKPSQLPITNVPLTLIDAINQAGGITQDADWNNVTITRGDQVIPLSLRDLMKYGVTSNNRMLKAKDIVHVPVNDKQKVFVLGEVIKPSVVKLGRDDMSLTEALGTVGGINELSSDATGIFVIRKSKNESVIADVFQLDITNASNLIIGNQFKLRPQDIVYVTAAPIARWNRVMTNLLPSINGFNQLTEGVKRIKDW